MKGGSLWEKLIQQRRLIPVSQMFLLMRLMYTLWRQAGAVP